MHQFFATLCSLLLALCQHTSLSAHPVEAAELQGEVVTSGSTVSGQSMILPDRYQLAHTTSEDGSYAGAACLSCRRMDASISVR